MYISYMVQWQSVSHGSMYRLPHRSPHVEQGIDVAWNGNDELVSEWMDGCMNEDTIRSGGCVSGIAVRFLPSLRQSQENEHAQNRQHQQQSTTASSIVVPFLLTVDSIQFFLQFQNAHRHAFDI